MSLRHIPGLAAMLVLAACGSSPKTNYIALSPIISGTAASHLAFPVQVVAVHIPPTLDRQEMVRMRKGETLDISDANRWSAPLDGMIRNVLSEDLQKLLAPGQVVLPTAPAPKGTASIVVSVSEFSGDAQGRVTLSGSWSLLREGANAPQLRRDFELHAAGGASADLVAAGMSNAVAALAGRIAATLAAGHA